MYRVVVFGALAAALASASCTADTPMQPNTETAFPSPAQVRLAGGELMLSVMTAYPGCTVAATPTGDDWSVPKQTTVCLEPMATNGSGPVARGTFVIQQCSTSNARVSKSLCETRDARWRTLQRVRCCDAPGSVLVSVPFVPTGGQNGYRIRYIAQGSGAGNGMIGPFDLIAAE